MKYAVIYDGCCNLCTTLVRALEQLERGRLFCYVPMQDRETLAQWQIAAEDCELGMIVLDLEHPHRRWQGSEAAERIAQLLPTGQALIHAYRAIPGLKALGDHTYIQVRDHRYEWFGRRTAPYQPLYPFTKMFCTDCDCPVP
jgi:predicted DCC family thiol-disulfide oxidoreductase YuxK